MLYIRKNPCSCFNTIVTKYCLYIAFQEENLHPPIGNTVEPEEEFIRDSDNPPRFCNRCFRSKVVSTQKVTH